MIEDTKQQIKEIEDQIEKINNALEQRQQVIND
jgi:peptidoglycan hydrolase CwlO-like protein